MKYRIFMILALLPYTNKQHKSCTVHRHSLSRRKPQTNLRDCSKPKKNFSKSACSWMMT